VAATGTTVTLDGANVIAMSANVDEGAIASAGNGTATVTLTSSNFDSFAGFPGASGTTNLTLHDDDPTNQDEPGAADDPVLAGATTGNPHQLPGSPTIDHGSDTATLLGTADIDDEARTQGAAIDIGADEADGVPPETTITKKPSKRTTSRRATFRFESSEPAGATFECKLDSKPYKNCSSPKKYRHLKPGRHKFRVRATDAFGNTDPASASYGWRVKRSG
jgi:hypothetical protein